MKQVEALRSLISSGPLFIAHSRRLSVFWEPPPQSDIALVGDHLWAQGGKLLRSRLLYSVGTLYGVPPKELELYAWAVEAVHTATLLHDDVIDEATRRRTVPSANALWDNTLPVITGDYIISEVFTRLAAEALPAMLASLAAALKTLCLGEAWQYRLAYRLPASALPYARVARLKTATLFEWCILCAPRLTGRGEGTLLSAFAQRFGLLFQWADDVQDIYPRGDKNTWADLSEGRLNLVTYPLVRESPDLRALCERDFARRHISTEFREALRAAAQSSQAREATGALLQRLGKSAKARLGALPAGLARDLLGQSIDQLSVVTDL